MFVCNVCNKTYCIDATTNSEYMGMSIGYYVDHRCKDYNLNVYVVKHNNKLRLCLFASHDIQYNDELLIVGASK